MAIFFASFLSAHNYTKVKKLASNTAITVTITDVRVRKLIVREKTKIGKN